jgi:hypothetical protein
MKKKRDKNMKTHFSLLRLHHTGLFGALLLLAACGTPSADQTAAMQSVSFVSLEKFETASGKFIANEYENANDNSLVSSDDSFEVASTVGDGELSDARGGFFMAGGFRIDFGITSVTSIDGVIKSSLNLTSNNLHGAIPKNLQQLVQTGGNNSAPSTSPSVPTSVLTVVQNNVNNTVIQNQNILNLTISNLSSFRNHSANQNSLSSFVRALH